MAWYWRGDGFEPVAGEDDLGLGDAFDNQSAAEAWLTSHYADLVDAGVHSVALYEESRLVYGPMSLAAD